MEDDSKLEASAEELAGVAQQLPDTETNLHNDGVSLHIIDPKDIDLLRYADINDLKDLDLGDLDLEGLEGVNIANLIASLQNQQSFTGEDESPVDDQTQSPNMGVQYEHVMDRAINEEVTQGTEISSEQLMQKSGNAGETLSEAGRVAENHHMPHHHDTEVPNASTDGQSEKSSVPGNETTTDQAWGTEFTPHGVQHSTDDGSLGLGALDRLDGAKLLEIQNAIEEFGGSEAFGQLLDEIKNDTTHPGDHTESSGALPSESQSVSDYVNVDHPESQSASDYVNGDQIPQELVSMSIGRLVDTSNFDMSSLSQDTQEQLMWLVNQLNNGELPQDEYGDEDDDDKSKRQARIREENRERKKRWREINQDRNKDNDLRCRVTKRAAKLFGLVDTNEKKAWMEAEFSKRKEKREAKERARHYDDRISTSPFYASYSQQQQHTEGASTSFSPVPQPLSAIDNRDSSEPALDFFGGSFRNRANSVAESTTSSINDGEGSDSTGALRILSDPEAAQKLLQNSEAMQLLSNNPEVLAFLQSVIENKRSESPSGDSNVRGSVPGDGIGSDPSAEVLSNTSSTAIESKHSHTEIQPSTNKDTTVSIDISAYLELSETELEARLATMDHDTAQLVLTELLQMQAGSHEDGIREAAGPSTTPVRSEVGLDPDVRRILDTPGDHHNDAGLDLSLVNDKLINFSAEDFTFTPMESDELNQGSLDLTMLMDSGNESGDINAKLLQALQGALDISPMDQLLVSDSCTPPAPPPTPKKSNCKKRLAPHNEEEEEEEESVLRKRHQTSPVKSLPGLSPDTAHAIAHLLQNSGINLQKLGAAPSHQLPPSSTTLSSAYSPGTIPHPATATPQPNTLYMAPNGYSAPSTPPRPAIPKPPVISPTHKPMSAAAAHAASFGNSAAMNQRLMPPPPYRPPNLGIGYGGFSPIPTIPKKRPDERIVKAMGFPPMLAGIKKKTPS